MVGLIPATVLTTYIFLLFSARTPQGTLDISLVPDALRSLDFGNLALIGLLALAIAFLLQPLQFLTVQLLEGYWGTSVLGQSSRAAFIRRNVERWADLGRQILTAARFDTLWAIYPDRAGALETLTAGP